MTKIIIAILFTCAAVSVQAAQVRVAVAANFTAAMKEVAEQFELISGHKTLVSYGSTGKLYAQIVHGAPYDVFLAADQRRPALLVEQYKAGDQQTYAIGRLVLWSADAGLAVNEQMLHGPIGKLAIANPKTAPYGIAAIEIMKNLGLYDELKSKLVYGDNIAQTYQFAASGNAELGFVAMAQVALNQAGSRWQPSTVLYSPIRQDAVLLKHGHDNPAAVALLEYLQTESAHRIIRKYGYAVE